MFSAVTAWPARTIPACCVWSKRAHCAREALVERVVGLAEGARLLPSLDTAAPVGVTLIDPRLT